MKRTAFPVLFLFILISCVIHGQESQRLEKVFIFQGNEMGYASLSSKEETILISYNYKFPDNKKDGGVYWINNGKVIKTLRNINQGKISPDGNYYLHISKKIIYVNNKNDLPIIKIQTQDASEPGEWSYDSKSFIFQDGDKIYKYNITTQLSQSKNTLKTSIAMWF